MTINFINEVTASMGVKNLDNAIAWYHNVLGFNLLYREDSIAWCELTTHMPGVNVGLSEVQDVAQGGGATNVWSVTDINAAKAVLDSHGVRQDGEIQTVSDMVQLLTFYDPDGNAMMLAQSLQG